MKRLALLCASLLVLCLLGPSLHAAPAPGDAPSSASKAPAAPVDINTAGEDGLMTVPGIGPSLAKRIVEFRQKNGPFAKVDDLMKVQGIGEKSLAKLRPYLTASAKKA